MPDATTLSLFFVASFLLLITPGPAVLYIVARSLDQGRMAGIVSTAGVCVGTLFHVAGAALGLSALLLSSALAFDAVKYVGAAYLVYLGARRLREKEPGPVPVAVERRRSRLFFEGIVVNVLNPKTALFFFAFLPQFVDPSRGPVGRQTLVLGLLFVVMAACTDSAWAVAGGSAFQFMRRSSGLRRAERYFSASVFMGLGITTALTGSGRK